MKNKNARMLAAPLVVLVATVGLAGCQQAKAGARCRTSVMGEDRTHILKCSRGRWVRSTSKADLALLVKRYLASQAPPSTTPPVTAPPVTTPPGPVVTYLTGRQVLSGATGGFMAKSPLVMNGRNYAQGALFFNCCNANERKVEFSIGRTAKRLLGEIGIPDNENSSFTYRVKIQFDGREVLSSALGYGRTIPLDLDATGVLRVSVIWTVTSLPCCGIGDRHWGIGDLRTES